MRRWTVTPIVMRDPLTRQQGRSRHRRPAQRARAAHHRRKGPRDRLPRRAARLRLPRAGRAHQNAAPPAGAPRRQGRRPTGLDDRYFRQAEDQLYGELGYVLGIAREDALAYIRERLGTRGAEE